MAANQIVNYWHDPARWSEAGAVSGLAVLFPLGPKLLQHSIIKNSYSFFYLLP